VAVASVKLVAVCPPAVTGGPEALHQLVHVANVLEPGSAAVLYQPAGETPLPYRRYGCPVVSGVPEGALVVLPEIWPEMSRLFPGRRCALWWLSVDNFGSHGQSDLSGIDVHLCQSEYAWRHVRWKVDGGVRFMLSDWVDLPAVSVGRGRRVVVNPAKDAGLLRPFMASHSGVEFGLLSGLDRVGVAELLGSSSVFIDFGRHPGRDRPPREAALAGCVVLSAALGSARLQQDMPIDGLYKFDSLSAVLDLFASVDADWDRHYRAQEMYRVWVAGQRQVFEAEVAELLAWLD
jgi:hypothetical protein